MVKKDLNLYWRKYSKEHRKTINTNRNRKKERDHNEIIKLLGGKCVQCGYCLDIRALCIDHVHGGGNEERRCGATGYHRYSLVLKKIKAGSKEYQLLCANCNLIKSFENQEWKKVI